LGLYLGLNPEAWVHLLVPKRKVFGERIPRLLRLLRMARNEVSAYSNALVARSERDEAISVLHELLRRHLSRRAAIPRLPGMTPGMAPDDGNGAGA
jgi:hypothetical protein